MAEQPGPSSTHSTSGTSSPSILSGGQMKPADLLKLLQKHAPNGLKYCLTMVPCEQEVSLEHILKEKRTKAVAAVANSEDKTAKRYKMPMEGAVITSSEIVEKLREREEEDRRKEEGIGREEKRGCRKEVVSGRKRKLLSQKGKQRK